jgi:5-methylcytosine-specific restriction endonuclease McrA
VSIASLKPRIARLDIRQGAGIAVERIRGYELTKIRARILLRDGYTCRVCGRSSADLVVDHVQPLHLGGAESDENRQSICPEPCHRLKSELEERERL